MGWQDEAPAPHPGEGSSGATQKRGRKPRVFASDPAVREKQRAFISLTGASGGGKTKTALELAAGLVSVTGGKVFVVDSENGRAKKYAPRPGETASPIDAPPEGKTYAFQHVDFEPPFDPDSYLDALHHCEANGAGCVIFDSMSHEHAGQGGRLDSHDAIAGDSAKKNFTAWKPNTDARNRLLWGGFFRSPCHIILCFRAKDKSGQDGSKIVDLGFTPVGGLEFIFEADCGLLFMPQASGVPTWRSALRGEQSAIKLPDEYRPFFRDDEAVNHRHGQRIAKWLNAGGSVARSDAPPADTKCGPVLSYLGAEIDPTAPRKLEPEVPIGMMNKDERGAYAKAIADVIKASDYKREWFELNRLAIDGLAKNVANKLKELAGVEDVAAD